MTQATLSVVLDPRGFARTPEFRLKVVQGPNKRKEKDFAVTRVLIGSGEGAQFSLDDPTVSGVHCEILVDESGTRVRDLGSKNGTFLDGRQIREAWLSETDDLTLGRSVIRFKTLGREVEVPLPIRSSFGRLRGSSWRMRELYAQLQRVAASDATVLIGGETGSGKELAAEAIHLASPRRDKPLVVVDCGALSPTLAEGELFGYEKGAFTDAIRTVSGPFERANGGTIFLDEIGELPLELQAKLLGVLERRVVQRLGSNETIPVDVRVIAATNRELAEEVNGGGFRADLFYRLAVVEVRIPPLREHLEDVPEIVAGFLEDLPAGHRLSDEVIRKLSQRSYPGNVRELRNAVERAVLGVDGPMPVAPPVDSSGPLLPFRVHKERLIANFERSYLTRLLEECESNVSEAARRSGLSRVHLYELMRRTGKTS